MPIIITGKKGSIYEGFSHPILGLWGQPWNLGYPHVYPSLYHQAHITYPFIQPDIYFHFVRNLF